MRILVETSEPQRQIPLRHVAQLLGALGVLHAAVRLVLDPGDAEFEIERLRLALEGEEFPWWTSGGLIMPRRVLTRASFGALESAGRELLTGARSESRGPWLVPPPYRDLMHGMLLRVRPDADALGLRSLRAGSLEAQVVVGRDLDALSRRVGSAFRRLVRALGFWLPPAPGEPVATRHAVERAGAIEQAGETVQAMGATAVAVSDENGDGEDGEWS